MITKSYVINHVIFFRRLGVQLIIHHIYLKISNMISLVIKYNLGKKKKFKYLIALKFKKFRYLCRELWKITLSEFDHNHTAPLNSFLFNFSQQWYLSFTSRKAKHCFLGATSTNRNFHSGWSMHWFRLFHHNRLSIYSAILFKTSIWELISDILYCHVNEKNKSNSTGTYMFALGYKESKPKCLDLIITLTTFYFI